MVKAQPGGQGVCVRLDQGWGETVRIACPSSGGHRRDQGPLEGHYRGPLRKSYSDRAFGIGDKFGDGLEEVDEQHACKKRA